MGSQAEYWTDIYATTHEQRLAQSMEAARAELKDRYALEGEYLKWLAEKGKMLEQERTKVQASLDEYSRTRGGKVGGGGADNTAAILGVIAEAGNTIARETGDAAQRKLEAQAAVQSRYRMSATQSSAVGSAGDKIASTVDATYRVPSDIDRAVGTALGSIPDGTFAPGSDASKTAAAELFARMDAELKRTSPTVYGADPTAPDRLKAAIAAKTGVPATFTNRAEVTSDEKLAIAKEQKIVGVTGTGTSKEAVDLAKKALDDKLGGANKVEADAVAQWVSSPQGAAYMSELQKTGDYTQALQAAAARLGVTTDGISPGALEQEVFRVEVSPEKEGETGKMRDIRSILQSSGASFDIQKFFDVGFLDLYGRSKTLEQSASKTFGELSNQWETLRSGVPTEEAVRRRGAEIYEPISPGVGARRRAAAVREEEARMGEALTPGTMRRTTGAGTVDDFLATRMVAPSMPEEQRVLAGASAAAVRFGPKFQPTGEWDAEADPGWRMYSNVREKQLRDTSPKAMVQYAADLAGGDPKKRDEILQSYYQWSLGEKQGLEARKTEKRVEAVEAPKPADVSGIKLEDIEGAF